MTTVVCQSLLLTSLLLTIFNKNSEENCVYGSIKSETRYFALMHKERWCLENLNKILQLLTTPHPDFPRNNLWSLCVNIFQPSGELVLLLLLLTLMATGSLSFKVNCLLVDFEIVPNFYFQCCELIYWVILFIFLFL